MATKYISRFGKVWQNRNTGKTYGSELELKDGDDIKNYTQVKAPDTAIKAAVAKTAAKATDKTTSIFETEEK